MSRRPLGAFQWPCASRGTASRSALPWVRRSSGGTNWGSACSWAVGFFMTDVLVLSAIFRTRCAGSL